MQQTRTTPGAGEWAQFHTEPKARRLSGSAHRLGADGRTHCGFIARLPVPPLPGARLCLICSLSEAS